MQQATIVLLAAAVGPLWWGGTLVHAASPKRCKPPRQFYADKCRYASEIAQLKAARRPKCKPPRQYYAKKCRYHDEIQALKKEERLRVRRERQKEREHAKKEASRERWEERAREALESEQYHYAAQAFLEAHERGGGPSLLLEAATAFQLAGVFDEARRRLQQTIQAAGKRKELRASAEEALVALDRPGSVRVTCQQEGAVVAIDGKDLGPAPVERSVPAGTIHVAVTLDKHRPFVRSLTVHPDTQYELEVELDSLPVEKPRPVVPQRTWKSDLGYGAVALGAALVVGAAVSVALYATTDAGQPVRSEMTAQLPLATDGQVTYTPIRDEAAVEEAHTTSTLAWVFGTVGVSALVAGIVLVVTDEPSAAATTEQAGTSASPVRFVVGPAHLGVSGSF